MSFAVSSFSLTCLLAGYYLGRRHRENSALASFSQNFLKEEVAKTPQKPAVTLASSHQEPTLPLESPFSSLPCLIWIKNEKQTITYKNKAYQAFEKYISLKERLDSPVFQSSQEIPLFEKVKKSRREYKTKFLRSVLGQNFAFDVWALPHESEGVLYIASDVSEYEKEQGAFKKSLRHFESTLDSLPMGMAIWGKNQRLQKFNSRFARLFQLDEKWLARHPFLDEVLEHLRHKRLLPEVIDFSGYKRRFQALFTESCRPYEEVVHLLDERTLRFLCSSYPEGGLLWVLEDLTEPLILKRKNNAMVSVLEAVSHHMKEGILLLGGDHRIVSLNSVCADLWGLDVTSSLEKNFLEILDSSKASFYYIHYFNAYKSTLINRIFNRTPHKDCLYRKDGLLIHCEYIPLPNGEHLLKFIDVTDSQKLKGLLHESRRLLMVDQYLFLRRVQQFKADFLQEVFLETPVVLTQKTLKQESSGKLLELFQSTQNLLGEGCPVVREHFLLCEVMEELLKIFMPLLEEKKLQFLFVGEKDILLLSNKILFTRFLSRLLGVGLYEAPSKTTLVFSVRHLRERVVITLSLRANESRSHELAQTWYYPWDLGFSLLKEMAALAGGVLSSGTAHPKRMRLVCSFQNLSSAGEVNIKKPTIVPLYRSRRQTRDAACG